MSFFEYYFSEYDFNKKETAVCCPFPHHTSSGAEYFESNPSAHINLEKGLYHCKVCGEGKSEVAFIAEIFGCSYEVAIKIQKQFRNENEDKFNWTSKVKLTSDIKNKCNNLGITDEVINELNIATEEGNEISFPVFIYDKLLDVRSYRPGHEPKIKSRKGALSGLIIPYDVWRESDPNKWTILCAGEKDMAVARSNGFNAITLTGGEQSLPLFSNCFKDRKIAICYDNDDAGISGANKIAAHLFGIAKEIRVVTNFHKVCCNKGEDITDYFTKYNKTKADLIKCVTETESFTLKDAQVEKEKTHPLISLLDATSPKYINRVVRSNIQVVATFDNTFVVPTTLSAKKTNLCGDPKFDRMLLGQELNWYLGENTAGDILKLIDNNFNEEQIRVNTREVLGIPKGEKDVKISKPTKETVHKCNVTDLFEVNTKDNTIPMEFTAYSIKRKLESGKKYRATYKLVPHPYKGQALIMIILDVEDSSDSVSNFTVTDDVIKNLNVISQMEGTVKERIDLLTERFKGVLGYNGYNQLIQTFDLAYHTVLEFNFGMFKNIRGYLDTLIVAESRVGKSTTAEALQRLYGLGTFTSLAGSSATIAGLIGGSNKVNGSYQTRAGIIPQNHRGLMIFEELAKSNANILRELTDIKSSNQVRITRVNGTLNLPALVRMVTLTNVKGGDQARSIASYPNGIEILMELIGTPEDIARFDMMLILGARGNQTIDPFWKPLDPLPIEVYRDRIRWVWSRNADQVIISEEVGRYIIECCNSLNENYDCYIKIFGTEAWKKVARLAIAVAGYLVSTDETYQNIVVQQEHVDFAVQFFKDLYDNETFRLKEYVDQERKYNTIDNDGVELLNELYIATPSLLLQLNQNSASNRANLMAATGLKQDDFNAVMNKLVKGLFVRYQGHEIVPTERFRLGMNRVNRNTYVTRVGEDNV